MAGTQWAFKRCVFLNKEIKLVQKVSMFRRIDSELMDPLLVLELSTVTLALFHPGFSHSTLRKLFLSHLLPHYFPSWKRKSLCLSPFLCVSLQPFTSVLHFSSENQELYSFFSDRCLHRGRRVRWERDWGSLHRRDRRASVFFILCCLSPK